MDINKINLLIDFIHGDLQDLPASLMFMDQVLNLLIQFRLLSYGKIPENIKLTKRKYFTFTRTVDGIYEYVTIVVSGTTLYTKLISSIYFTDRYDYNIKKHIGFILSINYKYKFVVLNTLLTVNLGHPLVEQVMPFLPQEAELEIHCSAACKNQIPELLNIILTINNDIRTISKCTIELFEMSLDTIVYMFIENSPNVIRQLYDFSELFYTMHEVERINTIVSSYCDENMIDIF